MRPMLLFAVLLASACSAPTAERAPAAPAAASIRTPGTYAAQAAPVAFAGYPCTVDCAGHQAGYDWAKQHDVVDRNDCKGKSQAFVEGCQTWTEEQEPTGEE